MLIYKKVKEACKEKRISIAQLEQDLGFARGSIYKWDKHNPSIEKMKMVAEKLEKTIEDLLVHHGHYGKDFSKKSLQRPSTICCPDMRCSDF